MESGPVKRDNWEFVTGCVSVGHAELALCGWWTDNNSKCTFQRRGVYCWDICSHSKNLSSLLALDPLGRYIYLKVPYWVG